MSAQPKSRFQSERRPQRDPGEMASAAWNSARESISTHPSTAVFSAFAAGLGIGIGLALAFTPAAPPPLDVRLRDKLTQFLHENLPWGRG